VLTIHEALDLVAMAGAAMMSGGLMALHLRTSPPQTPERVTIVVAPRPDGWEDDEDDTRKFESKATFAAIDFSKRDW
jgi:hypothetical protein